MGVLLELTDGTVVSHSLVDPPPLAFTTAVLTRTSRDLRRALAGDRTVRVGSGGPIRMGSLGDRRVTVVTVFNDLRSLGRLWFDGEVSADDELLLSQPIRELGEVLTSLSLITTGHDLSELLLGHAPLPEDLLDQQLFVVALQAPGVSPTAVADALRHAVAARPGPSMNVTVATHGLLAAALIATSPRAPSLQVREHVEFWIAQNRLRQRTEAGIAAVSCRDLPTSWQQAVTVLKAARPGCHSLEQVRSALLERRVLDALNDSADLGLDPVQALVDANEEFAQTLLAWLDHHGDCRAAAHSLVMHPNTLRYRLKRSQDLLPESLCDPVFRLEVHLRLRARFSI